jgi:integrase
MTISTTRQTTHATRFRFTPGAVERLRLADGERQAVFRDEEIKGFGVIVGRAGKSWFVERRIGAAGAPVKRTIDGADKMPLAEARKVAQKWLIQMRDGIDPHQQRRDADAQRKAEAAERERRAVTLRKALDEYVSSPNLRPASIADVRYNVERWWSAWLDRPVHEITADDVLSRFSAVVSEVAKRDLARAKAKKRDPRPFAGQSTANKSAEALGRVLTHALHRKWIEESPVDILTKADRWFPKRARNSQIKPIEYPAWFAALEKVRVSGRPIDRVATDVFEFILFTGLRESVTLALRWDWIDFKNRVLTVPPSTKGHKSGRNDDTDESKALRVVLCDRHLEILGRRRAEAPAGSPFVFPSPRDPSKHVVEVRSVIRRMVEAGCVSFTEHPLRRSFGNAARMAKVGYVEQKRLLGHSIDQRDVTEANYTGIIDDLELRDAMNATVAKIIEMSKPPTQPLRLTDVA